MLSCQTEEVCLEMHSNVVPDDCTVGFIVEFVWKSTSYDRMKVRQAAHTASIINLCGTAP